MFANWYCFRFSLPDRTMFLWNPQTTIWTRLLRRSTRTLRFVVGSMKASGPLVRRNTNISISTSTNTIISISIRIRILERLDSPHSPREQILTRRSGD